MEKNRVTVVLVVVMVASFAIVGLFLGNTSTGSYDEPSMHEFLRDFSERVAVDAFKENSTSAPVDMILGPEYYFTVVGNGNMIIQTNSSWFGFALALGSNLNYMVNGTLSGPDGSWQGSFGGGTSNGGLTASGQVLTQKQMSRMPGPEDHWNGTWNIEFHGASHGDKFYVMVIPILWIDPAYPL